MSGNINLVNESIFSIGDAELTNNGNYFVTENLRVTGVLDAPKNDSGSGNNANLVLESNTAAALENNGARIGLSVKNLGIQAVNGENPSLAISPQI